MYKRVLVKLSGEVFSGEGEKGFKEEKISYLVSEIKKVSEHGVNLGIVIGAGNIFRGEELKGLSRTIADHIGMLGTVINALYLKDFLEKNYVKAVVVSQIVTLPSIRPIHYDDIELYFDAGYVIIFSGGTSNPFFTTDTAAALRAVEMGAELLIKATKVNGIYDSDPRRNPNAKKIDKITYDEAIKRNLKIMDTEAFAICKRYSLPIIVLNFFDEGSLKKAIMGEQVGSIVVPE